MADKEERPISVKKFFLDSGAHTLHNLHIKGIPRHRRWNFFKTKEFWEYVDRYAAFLKKYKKGMDLYVTVDAIFNPEISWDVTEYMRNEHGLNPVPVIHYGTDLKWIDRHLEAGHKFLGIGGVGQGIKGGAYVNWADRVFDLLCQNKDRLPCVKTHGFAMTSHFLMSRYPWWSVDSVTWAKAAGFGGIMIPSIVRGKRRFDLPPYTVGLSSDSPSRKKNALRMKTFHYDTIREDRIEKKWVHDWADHVGMTIEELRTEYPKRAISNLTYFQEFSASLPKWPWSFHIAPKNQFNLVHI